MRIAIFSESYAPVVNGVTTSIEIFTRELKKLSHEVYIFAPHFPGYEETNPNVIRVPSYITPNQPKYPLGFVIVPGLARRFESLEIDLVHTQSPFALGMLGMRLARQFHLPLVTTNHTLYTEYAHYVPVLPDEFVRHGISKVMSGYCNRCDHVVAPSKSVKDLLESIGVKASISVVPTGIEPSGQVIANPDFPRGHYGIPADSPLLFFAGRIAIEKNLDMMIEAFEQILKEEPKAHLLLAGSGPHEEAIQEMVSEKGISSQVTFAGFLGREKLYQCYADSTAFLFPSTTDAQGLVVAEAMQQGLPTVAAAAYGPTEWIENGVSGFLCKNEASSMAEHALRLIRNPKLRQNMREAGMKFVSSHTAPHCANLLMDVYQKAIQYNQENLATSEK